ncbi:MAG: hypothetical protein L3J06_01715 [Cyclobacteriaceae bacterium]|nr:hypothetical protein [Cyclobacteriaceae bacterium]
MKTFKKTGLKVGRYWDHSNTTPILANLLTGKAMFTTFQEDDYGSIYIITTKSRSR